jgi:nickel-dependent lactate racemase
MVQTSASAQEVAADAAGQAALIGGAGRLLTDDQLVGFIHEQLSGQDLDGRSVCVVVPDATRSCPLPRLLSAVHGALAGRVSTLTTLIALGTHAAMSDAQLARHLGHPVGAPEARYPGMIIRNHEWWNPETFVSLGTISSERVAELSEGRLRESVQVRLNRAIVEHDVALAIGPVFPHEVVGFSGGNKYFFPGVAGPEVIDLSHWLGALITSADIIGRPGTTPVRALIDEAAALIPATTLALCVVARSGSGAPHAAAFGAPRAAWAAAAAISAQAHVRYLDAPVRRVLAVIPRKYDDIWTAAKGFYKLEPVVADDGEVILYAPHITQVAVTHPEILDVGYHCRDYFVKQWGTYRHLPWSVLAHSTHLRGAGTYDERTGERCRVRVTLATSIPEDVVRAVSLDYLDPSQVDIAAFEADPATFVVRDAGEILFRLR